MFVLVLGGRGLLGSEISCQLSRKGIPHITLAREQLDINNELAVHSFLKSHPQITLVINCCAYTDVSKSQLEIDKAYRINDEGPMVLANCCNRAKKRLIHFSTDYVFDGLKKTPYTESDDTNPINVYGKSKLAGENKIISTSEDYLIFRLQWLYGYNENNFVHKIKQRFLTSGKCEVVNDQFGSPCSAEFVSKVVIHNLKKITEIERGIYHLTHDNSCSWHEFACYIFEKSKFKKVPKPVSTLKFPSDVARPSKSIMNCDKLKNAIGAESLYTWESDFNIYHKKYLSL